MCERHPERGFGRRVRVLEIAHTPLFEDDSPLPPLGEHTVCHVSPGRAPAGMVKFRPLGCPCAFCARVEILDGLGPLPMWA